MLVQITCKNEKPIKNEGDRELSSLYVDFSNAQGQLTPVSGGILSKFKLIQALIHVHVSFTCKYQNQ